MPFSLPDTARPYTLSVSDQELSEWRQLLQLSKLAPDTFEGRQTDRRFGVTRQWLSDAKEYWLNQYDWRAQEARINSFDHYRMQVDQIDMHFIGYFSEKKDAIPILFMHGWPGSFIEFIPMLEIIRQQYSREDLPYHIIVASVPGYTLSGGLPSDIDWTLEESARFLNQLMVNLGFNEYIAQGGDIGSMLARHMENRHKECVAIHLNMFFTLRPPPDESSLDEKDKDILKVATKFVTTGRGYAIMQGTRPSTIGNVLASSPLALLAWIGEKFLEWTDEDPSLDDILTNVSLYWFTESYARSIYPYRMKIQDFEFHKRPMGFSSFPHEALPGVKQVVEQGGNLVSYKRHESGGHFAALEKPKALWADVEEFVAIAWKK